MSKQNETSPVEKDEKNVETQETKTPQETQEGKSLNSGDFMEEDEFTSSFFESSIEDLQNEGIEDDYVSDPNIYAPTLDDEKATNREYKAHLRWIKNPRRTATNGKKNIVSKYVIFMQNPNNADSKIMVDDVSHINRDNIVTNAFFHCRGHKSLAMQNLGKKNFSRRRYNFGLAKIEKDFQHPELDGLIKVVRFANQVDEILEKALENNPEDGISAKLYSDPLKGYKFILNINEKEVDNKNEEGSKMMMTNYTDSRFVDSSSILQFDSVPADWHTSQEGQRTMMRYVLDNSPILEDYEPKAWDEDTERNVIEAVRAIIDDPQEFDKIYFKTYKKSYYDNSSGMVSKPTGISNNEEVAEFRNNPDALIPNNIESTVDDSVEQISDVEDIDMDA